MAIHLPRTLRKVMTQERVLCAKKNALKHEAIAKANTIIALFDLKASQLAFKQPTRSTQRRKYTKRKETPAAT